MKWLNGFTILALVAPVCLFIFQFLTVRFVLGHSLLTSFSPAGNAWVEIVEDHCFADCRVLVVLTKPWPGTSRPIGWGNDCWLSFAHVAWSPNSEIVSIFVEGRICKQVRVAYDVRHGREVPFESTADLMRQSIAETYGLTSKELKAYENDPLVWASEPEDRGHYPAADIFRRRYRR